jgi:geranylgeranyl diphosphate synthase, type I
VGADIREGKRNLLFAKTLESLDVLQRSDFIARWGRDSLTEREVEALRGVIAASGARRDIEMLITDLRRQAETALESAPIPREARTALRGLATAAIDRSD